VPKLLRQIEVKGATVSLDAMGCQKKIAQEIHFAGADYLLAPKGNHGTLHPEVMDLFEDPSALEYGCSQSRVVAEYQSRAERKKAADASNNAPSKSATISTGLNRTSVSTGLG
jgi:predicted transposase YbfD/YdcC